MIDIDISTEEKRSKLYKLFESFNKISDIYNYYGIYDNSKNIRYIRRIAEEIGFDLSIYKLKRLNKNVYCLNCGKELNSKQFKFCSNSCSATYNNKLRNPMSQETKDKISKALSKNKQNNTKKVKNNCIKDSKKCIICGNPVNSNKDTCSQECLSKYMKLKAHERHLEFYKYYLENQEEFCRPNYIPKIFKKDFIEEQGGVCAICGCAPEWNGKPLVFIMDHIDGDASNNRRENLRCICPNCDSQLDTYKSKNKNSTRRNYWKEKIIKDLTNYEKS